MMTPELIAAMKEAGMTPDQIADAVKSSYRAPKKKEERATRIPDEWHVGEAEFAAAHKLGLSREQIQFEADKFKDFWTACAGSNARKLNWLATWRNWCRTAAERTKPRFQSQTYEKPKTSNQLHQEAVDRELAKIIHGEDHAEFTDNVIDLAQRDYRFTA